MARIRTLHIQALVVLLLGVAALLTTPRTASAAGTGDECNDDDPYRLCYSSCSLAMFYKTNQCIEPQYPICQWLPFGCPSGCQFIAVCDEY